jgi:hypothetical protein
MTAQILRKTLLRLTFIAVALVCTQCTIFDPSHTVEVAKPRLHKSWYKKSRWHRRISVGRFQLRVFEKSGVKKVKMRS